MNGRIGFYFVNVFKGGRLYDQQQHRASDISLNTYVREMLSHGYGLDITYVETDGYKRVIV